MDGGKDRMRGPKSARRGRGKGKATARPRPKMTRRVSWSEDLEEVKHFEGGSSQEDEQDWVSVEREQGDASSVANDGNAASDHATGNSDGDGIQEDCEEPPEHQHEDGSSQENESLVVTPDDAAVAVADAAAAAAEEMLLGKGLLADNITDSQFRMSRMVLLDRGTAIKPLGIDLAVRQPTEPGVTGTFAEVKQIHFRGVARYPIKGQLRIGDVITQVNGTMLSSIEPGAFLKLLSINLVELLVYNIQDARTAADDARRLLGEQKAALAVKAALERERADMLAEQQSSQARSAAAWSEYFADPQAWLAIRQRQYVSTRGAIEEGSDAWRRLVRTVYIDRRLRKGATKASAIPVRKADQDGSSLDAATSMEHQGNRTEDEDEDVVQGKAAVSDATNDRASVDGDGNDGGAKASLATLHDKPNKAELYKLGLRVLVRKDIVAGTFALIVKIAQAGITETAGIGYDVLRESDRILRIQGVPLSELTPAQTHGLLASSRLEMVVQAELYCRSVHAPKGASASSSLAGGQSSAATVETTLADMSQQAERVKALLNAKMSQWWNRTVDAGKQAIAELKDAKRRNNGEYTSSSSSASGGGSAGAAEMVDDNPVLPDMFHDFAPCPVVNGSSDIINGKNWCKIWSDLPPAEQYKGAHLLFDTAEHGYSLRNFIAKATDVYSSILVLRTEEGAVFGAYLSAPWRETGRGVRWGKYWGDNDTFVFTMVPTYTKFPWVGHAEDVDDGAVPSPTTAATAAAAAATASDAPSTPTAETESELVADVADGGADDPGPVDGSSGLPSKRSPRFFMTASKGSIAVGGGGNGHAIELDDDLHRGSSDTCLTFMNTRLHGGSGGDGLGGGIDVTAAQFTCVRLELWALQADVDEL